MITRIVLTIFMILIPYSLVMAQELKTMVVLETGRIPCPVHSYYQTPLLTKTIRVVGIYLWQGKDVGTYADMMTVMYRASDATVLGLIRQDRYPEPTGHAGERQIMFPGTITMGPGDAFSTHYFCDPMNAPGSGTHHFGMVYYYEVD